MMRRVAQGIMNGGLESTSDRSAVSIQHFSNIAAKYAFAQNEEFYRSIAQALCDEVCSLEIDPGNILELGAGTGSATEVLHRNFQSARIDCVEASSPMVDVFKRKQLEQSGVKVIGSARGSYDLVFSSMSLHWMSPLADHLAGMISALPHEGVVAFAVPVKGQKADAAGNRLILDTFKELRRSHVEIFRDLQWRGLSVKKLENELKGSATELTVSNRIIKEEIPADKFVETLYVRGVLLSFFGDKQIIAAEIIQRKVESLIELEVEARPGDVGQPAGSTGQPTIYVDQPDEDDGKPTIKYAWPLAYGSIRNNR